MDLEAETKKLVDDANEVSGMLSSRGWSIISGKLDERILDLQNINNIDTSDANTIGVQLAARKMAADLLFDFLKKDVYGFVEQQTANARAMPPRDDEIIERQSDSKK